jgi:hypothetical protein
VPKSPLHAASAGPAVSPAESQPPQVPQASPQAAAAAPSSATPAPKPPVNAAKASPAANTPPLQSPTKRPLPAQEREGAIYARRLLKHIEDQSGMFLKDEEGKFCVVIGGRSISLAPTPENVDLCELMLEVCGVSTVLQPARIGIHRLIVQARKRASQIQSLRFSALSQDRSQIYIPISGGKLLQISANAIQLAPNGSNESRFWIRHPKDDPFQYAAVDPQTGLADFERLIVDTLSCKHPQMRWFVAMHAGLFPFVRDLCTARFILVHQGSTQQGKTTGAKRFILLHGLGDVTGDGSVAALSNEPDQGLLVLDNREQANFSQRLIEYCLFLSTGGTRKRSSSDGSSTRSTNIFRPVGVITTIEGVFKAELEMRCVEMEFAVNGQKIGREQIETEILERRHSMNSALVAVLQRFLSIKAEHRETPNPRPDFAGHFTTLCDLLRAFGCVAGKPTEWAEEMIRDWDRIIRRPDADQEESELEYPIREILLGSDSFLPQDDIRRRDKVKIQGREGALYIVHQCAFLLKKLQEQPALRRSVPVTANGLSKRLSSERFCSLKVVKEMDAPEHKELKRTASRRPIGFFIPNDEVTVNDDAKVGTVIGVTPVAP